MTLANGPISTGDALLEFFTVGRLYFPWTEYSMTTGFNEIIISFLWRVIKKNLKYVARWIIKCC